MQCHVVPIILYLTLPISTLFGVLKWCSWNWPHYQRVDDKFLTWLISTSLTSDPSFDTIRITKFTSTLNSLSIYIYPQNHARGPNPHTKYTALCSLTLPWVRSVIFTPSHGIGSCHNTPQFQIGTHSHPNSSFLNFMYGVIWCSTTTGLWAVAPLSSQLYVSHRTSTL